MKRSKGTERVKAAFGAPHRRDDGIDEGLWEVAAMVYVGDVYALLVTDKTDAGEAERLPASDEQLWPFIR